MIKAVIFDMYETLITHYNSPLYMGKQIAMDMDLDESKFREIWNASDDDRTLGKRTLEDVIEEILVVNNRYSKELFELIVTKRRKSKEEIFMHMHPEIIPLLEAIKASNIKIGLITNCYNEERDTIRKSVLYKYFDSVCMSCELGIKKPDREIFNRCMVELNVTASECLYVGDGGSYELEAASSLGMNTVRACWYNSLIYQKQGFDVAKSPLEVNVIIQSS